MDQKFVDCAAEPTLSTIDNDEALTTDDIGEAVTIDDQGKEVVVTDDESFPDRDLSDLLSDFEDFVPESATRAVSASVPSASVSSTDIRQSVLSLVNQERRRYNRPPLRLNSQLTAAAQAHSEDMARHNHATHKGSDGSTFGQRAKRHGYNWRRIAENVASGQSSPSHVMSGWMKSSGHRSNLLNSIYKDIGIGIAYSRNGRPYWTQVFGA